MTEDELLKLVNEALKSAEYAGRCLGAAQNEPPSMSYASAKRIADQERDRLLAALIDLAAIGDGGEGAGE